VARRPPAPAELRRFSQRLGINALLDTDSRAYADAGLAHLRMDDDQIFERLLAEPKLLRLPLVRVGGQLSVGLDEETWRSWLKDGE
jgi:arsenate reductase (glutaredoxin)